MPWLQRGSCTVKTKKASVRLLASLESNPELVKEVLPSCSHPEQDSPVDLPLQVPLHLERLMSRKGCSQHEHALLTNLDCRAQQRTNYIS